MKKRLTKGLKRKYNANIMTENTKLRGSAKIFIFPQGKRYRAVCLDFYLIEEADTFEEVEKEIREAVVGYVEAICKNDLPDELLNRSAPMKYWKMFEDYQKFITPRPEKHRTFSKSVEGASLFSLPIPSLCAA